MTLRLGLSPSYATVHWGMLFWWMAICDLPRLLLNIQIVSWWAGTIHKSALQYTYMSNKENLLLHKYKLTLFLLYTHFKIASLQQCKMVIFADLQLTHSQVCNIKQYLLLHIIHILLANEEVFDYIDEDGPLIQPCAYWPPPSGYKTQKFVMYTTTINECSTEGNIEVRQEQYLHNWTLTSTI